EHPKQITLFALGPLTNIALAYHLDNKLFDNLEQIVFMGGTLDFNGNMDPVKEFNIASDVEACHIVLSNAKDKCPFTAVPIECCESNLMTWDIYDKIVALGTKKSTFAKQVLAMEYSRVHPQPGAKGMIMFDMLAIIALLYADYIENSTPYKTSIELNGTLTRGELVFDKRTPGPDVKPMDWTSVMFIKHFKDSKF
ncbi:unnamed protein product, partial [Oppiella nova]